MNKSLKIVLPILIFFVAIVISWLLVAQKPKAVHKPVEVTHPMVSVAMVESETVSVPVFTRGTVTPGTEIQLASEVGGQILAISDRFANGGFFRKGEVLLKIDPLEYDVNIKRAEASLAQARQALLQARAEKKARQRVKGGSRNALATYEVQVKQAEASFAAAKAELQATKLQKERTIIRAPFDGRVRMKAVSVGQYVRPGMQLGAIYAVDVSEIRLPLSDRQVGLVDIPLDFDSINEQGPMVTLVGEYGGKKYYWPGQVVRSEGGLDERNRLLYVIAQVEDPYQTDENQPGRPPLSSGFFVEAKIKGRTHNNLFVVPRRALRNGDQVWVVDSNNQLQRKQVDVLYKGKDSIYIKSGLRNGDKIVLSQLDIAVDGMKVRTNIQENQRRETADDQNLLGARSAPRQQPQVEVQAEPVQQQKTTGMIKEFSASEVRDLASKAKDIMDSIDDETKQRVTDSAQQMAGALKKIVAESQKVAEEVKQPEPQVVEPEPVAKQEAQPEPAPKKQDTGMSPLADIIAQDVEEMEAAKPEPEEPEVAEPVATSQPEEPVVSEPAVKPSASYASISKAIAPKPLAESIK
ncbi:MAG: efflux RND transporter periplasmic adaptor subunit [Pseudomonadales bacterium]|nr:efflux RND transporter periplasmic adaptor subunit [Pseudomonadales bacterium]